MISMETASRVLTPMFSTQQMGFVTTNKGMHSQPMELNGSIKMAMATAITLKETTQISARWKMELHTLISLDASMTAMAIGTSLNP